MKTYLIGAVTGVAIGIVAMAAWHFDSAHDPLFLIAAALALPSIKGPPA